MAEISFSATMKDTLESYNLTFVSHVSKQYHVYLEIRERVFF